MKQTYQYSPSKAIFLDVDGVLNNIRWAEDMERLNLDDMDFGIVSEHPLDDGAWIDKPGPYYEQWLLDNASRYCVGYHYT